MKTSLPLIAVALAGAAFTSTSAGALVLEAAWELNEGAGNTVSELLSGTASDNFSSYATWGAASPAPGSTASLTFDDSQGEHELNTNVDGGFLDGTGAKTFVAWVNTTNPDDAIISYSPGGGAWNGSDLRLLLDSNGFLRAEVSGGFFAATSSDGRITNKGWTMVAAIFDTDTNSSSLYVGGSGFVSSYNRSGNRVINTGNPNGPSNPVTAFPNIVLGGDQAGRSLEGGLDMVGIYSGAATGDQLDLIYREGLTAIPEPSTIILVATGAISGLLLLRRRK